MHYVMLVNAYIFLLLSGVYASDQGKEINNELNVELARRLGIEHRLTTYHPQVCINVHIMVYFTGADLGGGGLRGL